MIKKRIKKFIVILTKRGNPLNRLLVTLGHGFPKILQYGGVRYLKFYPEPNPSRVLKYIKMPEPNPNDI